MVGMLLEVDNDLANDVISSDLLHLHVPCQLRLLGLQLICWLPAPLTARSLATHFLQKKHTKKLCLSILAFSLTMVLWTAECGVHEGMVAWNASVDKPVHFGVRMADGAHSLHWRGSCDARRGCRDTAHTLPLHTHDACNLAMCEQRVLAARLSHKRSKVTP